MVEVKESEWMALAVECSKVEPGQIYDICVLTEGRYGDPKSSLFNSSNDPDWYVENVLYEDGLVVRAL
jgi:hypothetical protein